MNSVTLIGRLTKDPELRYSADQRAILTFSLAVDRPYSKEKTADFFRIVVFGAQAEVGGKYLSKGRQVAVQGRIQNNSYKTNTGETRYTTDIVAERLEFLGSAGDKPKTGGFQEFDFDPLPGEGSGSGGGISGSQIPEGFQALDDDDDIPF